MQAISNKYYSSVRRKEECKASDRFDARVEIAREVSRNVTALSNTLCSDILKSAMKGIYGKGNR